jgi:hypothetical protein
MKEWRAWVKSRSQSLALCMHEDYDALGCYVYELSNHNPPLSEPLIEVCEQYMARDPRRKIEGLAAQRGILRRETAPEGIKGPEAIVLRQLGCAVTLTFETASEQGLEARVAAQRCFLHGAWSAFCA